MTILSFSSSVMPSIIIWNKPFQIVISTPLGPHHTAGYTSMGQGTWPVHLSTNSSAWCSVGTWQMLVE